MKATLERPQADGTDFVSGPAVSAPAAPRTRIATADSGAQLRVSVDGKFFRLGERKFFAKGVTYGPFGDGPGADRFASPEQTERDFKLVQELGANVLRVYHVPPRWLLDLAGERQLKVMVDVPWPKHLCFLDSPRTRQEAHETVRRAVIACREHPAVFALSLVNEIPAEIVRWSGARRIERFIDELFDNAKSLDPACLFTFTNFPPTEFLHPQNMDFVCFNVFLHQPEAFQGYFARLQMLADTKPLVLAEFGMDALREGEARKCEVLAQQIELGSRGGLAGAIVFSFTDDWVRGGQQIEDWAFGLTTRAREPKASFHAVERQFRAAPHFPLPHSPKVSVVVASYNGGRTLPACLESLQHLNYPDYEVILVDDGSTDDTPAIARRFPHVRCIRQENRGLSAARNAGIAAATGEIVAFTDSDCRADEDWLHYLIGDLLRSDFVGIGGHNLLPSDDSPVAAAVMASPGGPAHVMLTDREAEHIPGCNMAFFRWALLEINGFDPLFRKAGDDVDVCWRLQQRGYRIGFSPAGFVWHYRRSTVRAYVQQQAGYGAAEAMLALRHPENFDSLGRSLWRGRIYAASKFGVVVGRSTIYHGVFGSGLFQRLYSSGPSSALMLCTSLEYYALITGPLAVLSFALPFIWVIAALSVCLPLAVCVAAGAQAALPPKKRRLWTRPLVAWLFFLQPLVRGLARYRLSLQSARRPRPGHGGRAAAQAPPRHDAPAGLCYWSDGAVDRYTFLRAVLARLETEQWPAKPDTGWSNYDAEIFGSRWTRLRLITATEQLNANKLNLRCRLESSWSLAAWAWFWGLLGVELVAASLLTSMQPWIWLSLLSMVAVALIFQFEKSRQRQAMLALLDQVAAELKLVKLD